MLTSYHRIPVTISLLVSSGYTFAKNSFTLTSGLLLPFLLCHVVNSSNVLQSKYLVGPIHVHSYVIQDMQLINIFKFHNHQVPLTL